MRSSRSSRALRDSNLARVMRHFLVNAHTRRTWFFAHLHQVEGWFGLRLSARIQPRISVAVLSGSRARYRVAHFGAYVRSTFRAPRFQSIGLCGRAIAATTPRVAGGSTGRSLFSAVSPHPDREGIP